MEKDHLVLGVGKSVKTKSNNKQYQTNDKTSAKRDNLNENTQVFSPSNEDLGDRDEESTVGRGEVGEVLNHGLAKRILVLNLVDLTPSYPVDDSQDDGVEHLAHNDEEGADCRNANQQGGQPS